MQTKAPPFTKYFEYHGSTFQFCEDPNTYYIPSRPRTDFLELEDNLSVLSLSAEEFEASDFQTVGETDTPVAARPRGKSSQATATTPVWRNFLIRCANNSGSAGGNRNNWSAAQGPAARGAAGCETFLSYLNKMGKAIRRPEMHRF